MKRETPGLNAEVLVVKVAGRYLTCSVIPFSVLHLNANALKLQTISYESDK